MPGPSSPQPRCRLRTEKLAMQSDATSAVNPPSGPPLPPVVPPSGRHIVQLFVVPGLIVAGVLAVVLGCGGLLNLLFGVGFSRGSRDFLGGLENPNADVRWRAASDLAQVLKRDDAMAADPELGLKLDELLNQSLDEMNRDTRSLADRAKLSKREQEQERTSLQSRRSYAQFLSACLGNMSLPIGVPTLTQLAVNEKGPDPKTVALLRRHAVWCLANLGESRKRFDKLPEIQRDAVLARLQQEADTAMGPRRKLARQTLDILQGKERPQVIGSLTECAKADDPFLRQMAAFALNFWDGTPAENALAEQTLSTLANDRGQGQRIAVNDED